MKQKIQRPKGTADISPEQAHIWQYTEALLRETARVFGYRETRFPTFEHTELFVRGVGDTTDVVQKEMYTFQDKGGRSITLRPEGTASTVRSYLENGEAQNGTPYKVYYIIPNFRYEKPQAGRLREHHQFGVECFGAAGARADAEIISLAAYFMERLHIRASLKINSIGCPECRPAFHQALKEYFSKYADRLCETCLTRLEKNPMRILDCKSEICSGIAKDAPRSIDFLCPECKGHFAALQNNLSALSIPFVIDTGIVRGLDYYTKTVFEFVSDDLHSTVCGGGRYDGLIEQLGGAPTPAVGFGCGLERLIGAAQSSGFVFPEAPACDIYLASADEAGALFAMRLAGELRALGAMAEVDVCARGLKAQMKHADRIGARFTAVLGESEVSSGQIRLKEMSTGSERGCPLSAGEIKTHLQSTGRGA